MWLIIALVASTVSAPAPHWARSWSSIRATAAKVVGVEARFIQKKRMPILTSPLVSSGRFTFRAPGHLRWEYRSPIRSLLEMKRGRVRRYLWQGGRFRQDARQRDDAMLIVLTEVTLWLSGNFQASPNFKATLHPVPSPRVILVPKKRALAKFIRRIVLRPANTAGAIARVTIHEDGASTTVIEFKHCQVTYR